MACFKHLVTYYTKSGSLSDRHLGDLLVLYVKWAFFLYYLKE